MSRNHFKRDAKRQWGPGAPRKNVKIQPPDVELRNLEHLLEQARRKDQLSRQSHEAQAQWTK